MREWPKKEPQSFARRERLTLGRDQRTQALIANGLGGRRCDALELGLLDGRGEPVRRSVVVAIVALRCWRITRERRMATVRLIMRSLRGAALKERVVSARDQRWRTR